jgi:hypothetical protein
MKEGLFCAIHFDSDSSLIDAKGTQDTGQLRYAQIRQLR